MYVCVCNAIRESDVRHCAQQRGATTPDQVFRAMDAEPQCRRCVPEMQRIIEEALRETEAMAQAYAAAG